mmetsp:Transcript_12179/g.28208  ORF Transcript_12179/g.28208 Transcript_12179/m.28208 type:complete len:84 (+) Transcript_12179:307-558(+)
MDAESRHNKQHPSEQEYTRSGKQESSSGDGLPPWVRSSDHDAMFALYPLSSGPSSPRSQRSFSWCDARGRIKSGDNMMVCVVL